MNSTGWAVVIVVILLIAGGAWWYSTQAPATPTQQNVNIETGGTASTTETGSNVPAGVGAGVGATVSTAPTTASVTYGASGFSPATLTVKKGTTVTWTNSGAGNMWVAADEHPTHTEYDGTGRAEHCASGYSGAKPFDQCATGGSYSFTFDKAGSFDYHNHAAAQFTGKVVVE